MTAPRDAELADIEATTQLQLTDAFKRHFTRVSGATPPETNCEIQLTYPGGYVTTDFITKFLTADDIRGQWQHVSYLKEFVAHFDLGSDSVETEYLIPFADTGDGCVYVAVGGQHADAVYHSDNGGFGISRLADTLDHFIEQLDISGD